MLMTRQKLDIEVWFDRFIFFFELVFFLAGF